MSNPYVGCSAVDGCMDGYLYLLVFLVDVEANISKLACYLKVLLYKKCGVCLTWLHRFLLCFISWILFTSNSLTFGTGCFLFVHIVSIDYQLFRFVVRLNVLCYWLQGNWWSHNMSSLVRNRFSLNKTNLLFPVVDTQRQLSILCLIIVITFLEYIPVIPGSLRRNCYLFLCKHIIHIITHTHTCLLYTSRCV